jgi:hypothetical protein
MLGRRCDEHMKVCRHENDRVNGHAFVFRRAFHHEEKGFVVDILVEDRHAIVSAVVNMKTFVWNERS